jgi:hypothetical protein
VSVGHHPRVPQMSSLSRDSVLLFSGGGTLLRNVGKIQQVITSQKVVIFIVTAMGISYLKPQPLLCIVIELCWF